MPRKVQRNTTIFLSYSRADSEFALRLAHDLKDADFPMWMDILDLPPGRRWDNEIEKALQACAQLLVILSPESVSSQNVQDEVSFALEEGKMVIPLILNKCSIPFRLRRLQHIDFSVNYDNGFNRLKEELKKK